MNIELFLSLSSFDDFKVIGTRLIDLADLPDWFWQSSDVPFNYNMLPDYCKLVNEYRMRFVIVRFNDGDEVGFCFKVIQIIKTKQIKLFEIPFSKNHNDQNVKLVIQHLYQHLKAQFVLLSNIYSSCEIDKENCNYYYNYSYYKARITPKYRRSHQLKRYESNFNLVLLDSLDETTKSQFLEIHTKWYSLKKNPASPKSFLNALKIKSKNIKYYIGYLNNVPCVCGIYLKTKFGIYIIFEYSLDRLNILYDTIIIYTSKILTEQLYPIYDDINIYKLGARKTEKGLLEYKERTSKDKIIAYKLNPSQLIS